MIIHPRLTKFSSVYTKGSLAKRFAMTEKINQKIFGNTAKLYPDKKRNYPVEIIEQCYNFCLPEEKYIMISPLNISKDSDFAGGTTIMEKMGMYVGYLMQIPLTQNNKINIKTLPTLMHESTHVLDFLLNPKFVRNDLNISNNPQFDQFAKFYDHFFYKITDENNNPEEILKTANNETKKFIKDLPAKLKISFLNFIRYSLQMEEHAYKQDLHYAKILKKLGKPVDSEELVNYNKLLLLPEKLRIAEELLAKTIKEERSKLKTTNKIKN